ncbi:ergothioneine biosynthesis glutamate--cysteine ligase EgtA [Mycobacterium sp. MBM]|nr:ergothioneine biosynthesis glutamate--cysteine ligase EgtA [Mycobacterium sp. MBM]
MTTAAARDMECASGLLAAALAENCLRDGPVGKVGLEIEALCFDATDPRRRPGWDELSGVIATAPTLPGGSVITVEPGGAIELSGPPADGVADAITDMAADRAALRQHFAEHGLALVLLGADPLRPPLRVNPGARYRAMESYFAATGTAAAGAAMMSSTASVQINIEAGPRAGWADRVRLAHALGPTMIAVTANSPLLGGHFTGWRSSRQRVWGQLDSARCGPILCDNGDDPAADWAHYALRAPVMLVHTPEAVPMTEFVSYADWADGRVVLDGRVPDEADLEYHLTTLFPPVRPRRWLEIRYLDSVPDQLWPAVVFTLVTLLDNPAAAAIAADATAPVRGEWDIAARAGLADPRLQASAAACVAAAAEHAPDDLADAMARLLAGVEAGRCPGDDFSDRVVEHGIPTALTQLARSDA